MRPAFEIYIQLRSVFFCFEIQADHIVSRRDGTLRIRYRPPLSFRSLDHIGATNFDFDEGVVSESICSGRSGNAALRVKEKDRNISYASSTGVRDPSRKNRIGCCRSQLLACERTLYLLPLPGNDRNLVVNKINCRICDATRNVNAGDRVEHPPINRRLGNNDRIIRCARLYVRVDIVLICLKCEARGREIYRGIGKFRG